MFTISIFTERCIISEHAQGKRIETVVPLVCSFCPKDKCFLFIRNIRIIMSFGSFGRVLGKQMLCRLESACVDQSVKFTLN